MNKNINFISALAIFLTILSACNSTTKEDHSKPQMVKDAVFYTCSMDPQVKEDKAGKCPICHMDLTPIKQDDTAENELKLSEQQIKLGNITTITITESEGTIAQNFNGVLTFNQEKINTVTSRSMGRIEKLYFKTVGDIVKINDPIYSLYSEEIAIVKQDYISAFKQLEMPGNFGKNANSMLNAAKEKLLFFGLNKNQIEKIKVSKDISPYTTFYSTYTGTITEIMSTEGGYVMEGSSVLKLADLQSLWLETQVNVNYAKNLKVGQKASVSFPDFPRKSTRAKVSFINPEINPDTRLLLIRVEIANENSTLKPGIQALANITLSNTKGLYIPVDAVIREENATYIWMEKKPGVFENVMVETGIETNGMVEIKTKLDSSKKVVITGAYSINSEYRFRKGSNPMEGHNM